MPPFTLDPGRMSHSLLLQAPPLHLSTTILAKCTWRGNCMKGQRSGRPHHRRPGSRLVRASIEPAPLATDNQEAGRPYLGSSWAASWVGPW